jgi:Tol biopolymer transport system component
VFAGEDSGPRDYDLYVTRSDGSTARRQLANLTDFQSQPAWSPDGRRIAFGNVGIWEIFTIRPNGSGLRQVTHTAGSPSRGASTPTWSPRGDRIAYQLVNLQPQPPSSDIHVTGRDGSGDVWLTRDEWYNSSPSWSSDGKRVVFLRSTRTVCCAGSEIYTVRRDGSGLHQVTDTPRSEEDPNWGVAGGG